MKKLIIPLNDEELVERLEKLDEDDMIELLMPSNVMTTNEGYCFQTLDNYYITISE